VSAHRAYGWAAPDNGNRPASVVLIQA
jgi:hypothetical protein